MPNDKNNFKNITNTNEENNSNRLNRVQNNKQADKTRTANEALQVLDNSNATQWASYVKSNKENRK